MNKKELNMLVRWSMVKGMEEEHVIMDQMVQNLQVNGSEIYQFKATYFIQTVTD